MYTGLRSRFRYVLSAFHQIVCGEMHVFLVGNSRYTFIAVSDEVMCTCFVSDLTDFQSSYKNIYLT